MNFIIDPLTKMKYSLFDSNGKQLLKKYIKHVQIGGNIRVDRNTGEFYGINPSGEADATFFNNLGIRSYGRFNARVLEDFIETPTYKAGRLNMSLLEALDNLSEQFLKIDDGNGPGPEQDINNAIEIRINEGQRYESHDKGHVHWAALLGKIRNYIRTYKTYVNRIENSREYTEKQKNELKRKMLGEIETTNLNTRLYESAFEQASATKNQERLDMKYAEQNVGASKPKPKPVPKHVPKPVPKSVPVSSSTAKSEITERQRKEYEYLKQLLQKTTVDRIKNKVKNQIKAFESKYIIT